MQPEPAKTRLSIGPDTPKSSTTSSGRPTATASSAAVEDTVTSPRAPASTSVIGPVTKPTASAGTSPRVTRSCHSTS